MEKTITIMDRSSDKELVTHKFNVEEWRVIQQLIETGLDFEIDSYDLVKELSLSHDTTEEALEEIVTSESERKLILRLKKDKELVEKIKNMIKFSGGNNVEK